MLDVLLRLDHSLDVQLAADGSATERLVTTYTNHHGPTLPLELAEGAGTGVERDGSSGRGVESAQRAQSPASTRRRMDAGRPPHVVAEVKE